MDPYTILDTPDYDTNNNGLIDITTLAQLNAIRWDLNGDGDVSSGDAANYLLAFPGRDTSATGRMGCQLTDHDDDTSTPDQATCTGYELMNDLDFDENDDGQITAADAGYWNSGAGWQPIGVTTNEFTATLQGNGHVIANLFINLSTGISGIGGLFGTSTGRLSQLGLVDVEITAGGSAGGLVGDNRGTVSTSYASGQVTGGSGVGGLVGLNRGSLTASYARVQVRGNERAGGLVGSDILGTITTSYATGQVTGTDQVGGLVGIVTSSTITASYWDTTTSGIADDTDDNAPEGKTTAELQAPTGYTGIYADWNIDVDGGGNDNPWAFGEDYQYPVLRHGRTQAQINAQFRLQGDVAFADANINQDSEIDEQDALIMYQTYLPALRGTGVAADDRERATAWQESGRAVGGDLNGDGPINHRDALIMYYAYAFEDLLNQSAVLRQLLLNGVRGRMPDTDATYRELLRRAKRLR